MRGMRQKPVARGLCPALNTNECSFTVGSKRAMNEISVRSPFVGQSESLFPIVPYSAARHNLNAVRIDQISSPSGLRAWATFE